jgi:ganglioside-induced differentiation-associated protein 1
LAEKGLEWESRLMALNGDQLDPAYLKLNPNGVVPTLVHLARRLKGFNVAVGLTH